MLTRDELERYDRQIMIRGFGVTPAVIGCIQATEVIKYIVGIGELLTDRLLTYDGLTMKFTEFKVKRDPNCEHCGHLVKER